MPEVQMIAMDSIKPSEVALRSVNKQGEDYIQIADSIKQNGILNPISVCRFKDDETGEEGFTLVDGLHRFTGAGEAGLTEIPALILVLDKAEVLVAQISANIHRKETRPVEFSKSIRRLMAYDTMATVNSMAIKLCKTPSWVSARLSLLKLTERAMKLVNDGDIKLANAYQLAKFPDTEQNEWIDRAIQDIPQEFAAAAHTRQKELKDAVRKGRDAAPVKFDLTEHLRKVKDIQELKNNPAAITNLIEANSPANLDEAISLALSWVLNVDDATAAQREEKWDQAQAEKERLKKERAEEREQKKAKAAAEKAVGV